MKAVVSINGAPTICEVITEQEFTAWKAVTLEALMLMARVERADDALIPDEVREQALTLRAVVGEHFPEITSALDACS